MEGVVLTRDNVVGMVFPCEDQGGRRGITVTGAKAGPFRHSCPTDGWNRV
jgi:hypothetical protein